MCSDSPCIKSFSHVFFKMDPLLMQPIHLLAPLVGFIIRKGLTVVKFRWLFYNNLKKGMNPNEKTHLRH
ncbi:predicted protein [Enterococcus gallinarum EG2]|nr:predicted protein [Enterococcus gallinarum EG2]